MVSGMIFHDVIGHHVCVCVCVCVFDSIDPLTRFVLSYWSSLNVSALSKDKFFFTKDTKTYIHTFTIGHRVRAHAADRPFKVHLLFYPGLESRGYLTWHLPIKQIKCNHLPPLALSFNIQMSPSAWL